MGHRGHYGRASPVKWCNSITGAFLAAYAAGTSPSFIASVYGMNFKCMPALEWPWGHFTVLGAMPLVVASALRYFQATRLAMSVVGLAGRLVRRASQSEVAR